MVIQARYRRSSGGSSGAGNYSGRSGTPEIVDRLIACVPYLLPLLDAFMYGRYLFYQLPVLRGAIQPLIPLLSLYHSVPFAPLICFFGVYIGIVNNRSLSR